MNITLLQTNTEKVTIDINDGYYVTKNVSTSVFKVIDDNIIRVTYYENANDGLFLNTSIEIIQAYLFASVYYKNCISSTEEHFKLIFHKANKQINNLTL